MANDDRSRQGALRFMDYLSQKGLMAPATARARKAALGKILAVLDDDEAQDVTKIDFEDTVTRFTNLQGQNYTPQSLQVYKSRAKSSLEDFETYLDNPLGFRPSINKRSTKASANKKETTEKSDNSQMTQSSPDPKARTQAEFVSSSILPIPIRPDVTVRIQGLPYDLTEQEAGKIAAVVKAMAIPE